MRLIWLSVLATLAMIVGPQVYFAWAAPGLPVGPHPGVLGGGGGGQPTFVIAANNSSAQDKASASDVCASGDDGCTTVVQNRIEDLCQGQGGTIAFAPGTFEFVGPTLRTSCDDARGADGSVRGGIELTRGACGALMWDEDCHGLRFVGHGTSTTAHLRINDGGCTDPNDPNDITGCSLFQYTGNADGGQYPVWQNLSMVAGGCSSGDPCTAGNGHLIDTVSPHSTLDGTEATNYDVLDGMIQNVFFRGAPEAQVNLGHGWNWNLYNIITEWGDGIGIFVLKSSDFQLTNSKSIQNDAADLWITANGDSTGAAGCPHCVCVGGSNPGEDCTPNGHGDCDDGGTCMTSEIAPSNFKIIGNQFGGARKTAADDPNDSDTYWPSLHIGGKHHNITANTITADPTLRNIIEIDGQQMNIYANQFGLASGNCPAMFCEGDPNDPAAPCDGSDDTDCTGSGSGTCTDGGMIELKTGFWNRIWENTWDMDPASSDECYPFDDTALNDNILGNLVCQTWNNDTFPTEAGGSGQQEAIWMSNVDLRIATVQCQCHDACAGTLPRVGFVGDQGGGTQAGGFGSCSDTVDNIIRVSPEGDKNFFSGRTPVIIEENNTPVIGADDDITLCFTHINGVVE